MTWTVLPSSCSYHPSTIHHPTVGMMIEMCHQALSSVSQSQAAGTAFSFFCRIAHHLYHRNFNYPCHGEYVIIINITILRHHHNPFTPRAIFSGLCTQDSSAAAPEASCQELPAATVIAPETSGVIGWGSGLPTARVTTQLT